MDKFIFFIVVLFCFVINTSYSQLPQSCDTIYNVFNETVTWYPLATGWGNYSGHNSLNYTQFAEKFTNTGFKHVWGFGMGIVWITGLPSSYFTFKIWKTKGVLPGDVIYSQPMPYSQFNCYTSNFTLLPHSVQVPDTFFLGFEINYTGYDTMSVYQAKHRGQYGLNTAYFYRNNVWQPYNIPGMWLTTSFEIYNIMCSTSSDIENTSLNNVFFEVYPSPSDEKINLRFINLTERSAQIKIYSITGNEIYADNILITNSSMTKVIDVSLFEQGIYIITINTGDKLIRERFVKN